MLLSLVIPIGLAALNFTPIGECRATDGDTLRCGAEQVRLLGIDAPEMPGHCRRGRDCAPGDPFASKASLQAALRGELRFARQGRDKYGRTLAAVSSAVGDLSCWQLARGQAIYVGKWDEGGSVASRCRDNARRVSAGVAGIDTSSPSVK